MSPAYEPPDPVAVEAFNLFSKHHRNAYKTVTAKLRKASIASITPARRRREKKRLAYLLNESA